MLNWKRLIKLILVWYKIKLMSSFRSIEFAKTFAVLVNQITENFPFFFFFKSYSLKNQYLKECHQFGTLEWTKDFPVSLSLFLALSPTESCEYFIVIWCNTFCRMFVVQPGLFKWRNVHTLDFPHLDYPSAVSTHPLHTQRFEGWCKCHGRQGSTLDQHSYSPLYLPTLTPVGTCNSISIWLVKLVGHNSAWQGIRLGRYRVSRMLNVTNLEGLVVGVKLDEGTGGVWRKKERKIERKKRRGKSARSTSFGLIQCFLSYKKEKGRRKLKKKKLLLLSFLYLSLSLSVCLSVSLSLYVSWH